MHAILGSLLLRAFFFGGGGLFVLLERSCQTHRSIGKKMDPITSNRDPKEVGRREGGQQHLQDTLLPFFLPTRALARRLGRRGVKTHRGTAVPRFRFIGKTKRNLRVKCV